MARGSAGGEAFAAGMVDSSESDSTGSEATVVGLCSANGAGGSVGLEAGVSGSSMKSPNRLIDSTMDIVPCLFEDQMSGRADDEACGMLAGLVGTVREAVEQDDCFGRAGGLVAGSMVPAPSERWRIDGGRGISVSGCGYEIALK